MPCRKTNVPLNAAPFMDDKNSGKYILYGKMVPFFSGAGHELKSFNFYERI